jgi:hypothetical protein
MSGRAAHRRAATAGSGVAATTGDVVWVSIDGDVFEVRVSRARGRGPRLAIRMRSRRRWRRPSSECSSNPAMPCTRRHARRAQAMKMELPIRAPRDGIVRAVNCRPGDLVQPGVVLVELE